MPSEIIFPMFSKYHSITNCLKKVSKGKNKVSMVGKNRLNYQLGLFRANKWKQAEGHSYLS